MVKLTLRAVSRSQAAVSRSARPRRLVSHARSLRRMACGPGLNSPATAGRTAHPAPNAGNEHSGVEQVHKDVGLVSAARRPARRYTGGVNSDGGQPGRWTRESGEADLAAPRSRRLRTMGRGSPRVTATPLNSDSMTSKTTTRKAEEKRAYQEATRQFEALRARWPNAFPTKGHLVRPLASGAVQALVEELGWSAQYARTVLRVWKLKPAYCQAVLRYPTRMNLDGSPSVETVSDEARQAATRTLAEIAARRIERAEKAAQQAAQEATTEPAPTTTASEPKPEADPAKVCLHIRGSRGSQAPQRLTRDGGGPQAPARRWRNRN